VTSDEATAASDAALDIGKLDPPIFAGKLSAH
jgi:hypothetical protein